MQATTQEEDRIPLMIPKNRGKLQVWTLARIRSKTVQADDAKSQTRVVQQNFLFYLYF